jgi:hypothetical protein
MEPAQDLPNGLISTVTGSDSAYSDDPKRPQPHGPGEIALDAAGNLYIAEPWNSRIRKMDRRGRITTVVGGGGGTCCGLAVGRKGEPVYLGS